MDNIKVKLANPYIVDFSGSERLSDETVFTLPSKIVNIEPAFLDNNQQASATYKLTLEDGNLRGFGVVFLLAQTNDINPDYIKHLDEQKDDGKISSDFFQLAKAALGKSPSNAPDVNNNRYSFSLSKSAIGLSELVGRGEEVSINYSYQLQWPDTMSKNTVNSFKFAGVVDGIPANVLTTPNIKYEGLSNWAGTSYNAFWCAFMSENFDPQDSTKVKDYLEDTVEKCVSDQIEAADQRAGES